MSRVSRQREAEWAFKAEMRRRHEERLKQERRAERRLRRWLVLLRHQDQCACHRCGEPSAGPWVTPENDLLLQPTVIDWSQSANLLPCALCGAWLCRRCAIHVPGVGRRCGAHRATACGAD